MDQQHLNPKYTCPMHPEIIKDAPGNCPLCGMSLVSVKNASVQTVPDKMPAAMDHTKMKMPARPLGGNDEPLKQQQSIQQYTCTMHPQIIRDEPGNCPLCGMVLVPLKKSAGEHTGHGMHVSMIDDF